MYVCMYVGMVLGYSIGYAYSSTVAGWRSVYGWSSVLDVVMFVGTHFMYVCMYVLGGM